MKIYKVSRAEYDSLMRISKCWSCGNFCGNCSWSEKDTAKPVNGWKATKRVIDYTGSKGGKIYDTYFVHECPQYVCDCFCDESTPTPTPNEKKEVYLLKFDGELLLFESLYDAGKYLKDTDPSIKSFHSIYGAIKRTYQKAKSDQFMCRGYFFKKRCDMERFERERKIRQHYTDRIEKMQAEYESRIDAAMQIIDNQQGEILKLTQLEKHYIEVIRRMVER